VGELVLVERLKVMLGMWLFGLFGRVRGLRYAPCRVFGNGQAGVGQYVDLCRRFVGRHSMKTIK